MKKWFLVVMLVSMAVAVVLLVRIPQTSDPIDLRKADPQAAANRSFDAGLRPAAFTEPRKKKVESPVVMESSPADIGASAVPAAAGQNDPAVSPTPEAQPPGVEGREQGIAVDILAMPDGDAKNLAFTELMDRWGEEDIENAWAFFDQIKDDI